MVLVASGHTATGQDQIAVFGAVFQRRLDVVGAVERMAQIHQLIAEPGNQCAQHRAVGVVNLPVGDLRANGFDLVAGGQNAHP